MARAELTRAVSLGLVFSKASGKVVRLMCPDWEEELDLHRVEPHEYMLRLPKAQFGVSLKPNDISLAQVAAIIAAVESPP